MKIDRQKASLVATLALFAALGIVAWKSGRAIFETGPILEIAERDGTVILTWRHEVEAPMAQRFADAFDKWQGRSDHFIIDLSSPGGSLPEGRLVIEAIGRMKASHQVDTHVDAESICLSMCVPIFLAGEHRTAAPSAVFMFHEPSTRDFITDERIEKPGFEQRMDSERFFERYFVRSEMDAEWRERLRRDWKGRDLWFTAEELVAQGANVVKEYE